MFQRITNNFKCNATFLFFFNLRRDTCCGSQPEVLITPASRPHILASSAHRLTLAALMAKWCTLYWKNSVTLNKTFHCRLIFPLKLVWFVLSVFAAPVREDMYIHQGWMITVCKWYLHRNLKGHEIIVYSLYCSEKCRYKMLTPVDWYEPKMVNEICRLKPQ